MFLTCQNTEKLNVVAKGDSSKQLTISGKVIDENNVAIVGANVTNLTTNFNVITDENGNFTLPIASYDDEIKFDHVQFDYDIIKVKDYNGSTYQLFHRIQVLDDVVIDPPPKQKSSNIFGWLIAIAVTVGVINHFSKEKPKTLKA